MLDPRTIDWSDIPSETEYETQLENFKKKDGSLDTTKQYSENASTSEEGSSIVSSPWLSSSSKFNFQSSSNKTVEEKVEQIRNLHGSFVFLNVFDLTADITGADFIQFYNPLCITSIVKYPNGTMLDLEFSCKDDAITALEKGVGMINGCLFSVRVSKRNYNPNVYRQRRSDNERYNTFYAKKNPAQAETLITYTKKAEVQAPQETEEEVQSLQTINETNQEEVQKVPSIVISQSETTETETCISEAKTLDILSESITNSPQIDMVKSVSMTMTSPQTKRSVSKMVTRTPPVKVGKYRNIVRSSGSKTQEPCQPSAEEMEKVNKLQRTLIEQFLQEKAAAEKRDNEERERIQREKELKEEQERLEREKAEQEERERLQREEEEERVRREEEEKERQRKEEEASKPVRKEVYEKVIYQRTSYYDRDDGYYNRNSRYSYDNYRYPRTGGYKFATVEKEYTPKKNF